jgi:hypothetical protein
METCIVAPHQRKCKSDVLTSSNCNIFKFLPINTTAIKLLALLLIHEIITRLQASSQ